MTKYLFGFLFFLVDLLRSDLNLATVNEIVNFVEKENILHSSGLHYQHYMLILNY